MNDSSNIFSGADVVGVVSDMALWQRVAGPPDRVTKRREIHNMVLWQRVAGSPDRLCPYENYMTLYTYISPFGTP